MNTLLTAIHPLLMDMLIAVVVAISGIVGKLLLNVRARVEAFLDANTNAAQRNTINNFAKEAFVYAEKAYSGYNGGMKLRSATQYFTSRLQEKGISISEAEIDTLIERAVTEYNLSSKTPSAPVVTINSPNLVATQAE